MSSVARAQLYRRRDVLPQLGLSEIHLKLGSAILHIFRRTRLLSCF
jgi:hypothetical protein